MGSDSNRMDGERVRKFCTAVKLFFQGYKRASNQMSYNTLISGSIDVYWLFRSEGDYSTYCSDKSHHHHLSLLSPTLSLPIPVPEAIDAYINASKTVLKQGEPLTVNCTVHGSELVFFSWDFPNREVSRSGAEQALLFSFRFLITSRPRDRAQIATRCRDTPQFFIIPQSYFYSSMWCWYRNNRFLLGSFWTV